MCRVGSCRTRDAIMMILTWNLGAAALITELGSVCGRHMFR